MKQHKAWLRALAIALTAVLLLGTVACGKTPSEDPEDSAAPDSTETDKREDPDPSDMNRIKPIRLTTLE